MMEVSVYGFGSAFNGLNEANDVDLLIVHSNSGRASCQFAVSCKEYLKMQIKNSHITMLSRTEEAQFQFIATSQADFLGVVCDGCFEEDVAALLVLIEGYGPTNRISI